MSDARRRASPEDAIQRAAFQRLRLRGVPGVFAFHPADGAYRKPIEAAILKACGVVAGVPDVICICQSKIYALELKAEGGRATPEHLEEVAAISPIAVPPKPSSSRPQASPTPQPPAGSTTADSPSSSCRTASPTAPRTPTPATRRSCSRSRCNTGLTLKRSAGRSAATARARNRAARSCSRHHPGSEAAMKRHSIMVREISSSDRINLIERWRANWQQQRRRKHENHRR